MSQRKARYDVKPQPNGKYNAIKTELDGIVFDSRAEAMRYQDLKLLQASGTITDLAVHTLYELQPAFKRDGKRERAICYECDFEYYEAGQLIVEDVKGAETETWKLKRKLFLYNYPTVTLRVIPARRYSR